MVLLFNFCLFVCLVLNYLCPDFAFPAGRETRSVFSSDACWRSFSLLLVIISDVLLGRKLQFGWLVFVLPLRGNLLSRS